MAFEMSFCFAVATVGIKESWADNISFGSWSIFQEMTSVIFWFFACVEADFAESFFSIESFSIASFSIEIFNIESERHFGV